MNEFNTTVDTGAAVVAPVGVGLIGLGGMGGVHLGCYLKNSRARVLAVCDSDPAKLQGGAGTALNIGGGASNQLEGIDTCSDYRELLARPDIDLIDICLPTPLHEPVTVAALAAGKHVLCEKPMALHSAGCANMEAAAQRAGKQLLVGHCLRFWPEYRQAAEIIHGGEYGRPVYARFHRSSGTPWWSSQNWMRQGAQSGGVALDMHIHDADAALWWFGRPQGMSAQGLIRSELPLIIDARWQYDSGLQVALHGSWDDNGGAFRYSFMVVLEGATIARDSLDNSFKLWVGSAQGGSGRDLPVDPASPYQLEIDEMVSAVAEGRPVAQVSPASSRLAVEIVRQEMELLAAPAGAA